MEDFPKSASGEEQEAKGRRRERADLGFPIFCLWKMLCRGLCFVNVPRNAFRLGLPDRGAQLFQLCASQEPLAAVLCKLVDLTSRICALRYGTDPSPEGIYTADHCEHAIGLERCRPELAVNLGKRRPRYLVSLGGTEFRLHYPFENISIESAGARLTLRLDVFGHEAIGQFDHSWRRTF